MTTSGYSQTCERVVLLGAVDEHPERSAKLPKFLSVLLEAAGSVTLVSASCPNSYRDRVHWVHINATRPPGRLSRVLAWFDEKAHFSWLTVRHARPNDTVVSLRRYLVPALLARLKGCRTVRYHAGPGFRVGGGNGIKNWVAEALANRIYHTIAVPSKGCVATFELDKQLDKVVINPFHIDDELFAGNPAPVRERQHTLGYFGNLTRRAGGYRAVDELITAHKSLRNKKQDISLVLGGVGPLQAELDCDASSGIVYCGWLESTQIKEWLDSVKLLVLPSIDEGLATILLQAMARGAVVVAADVAGNPDVIEDGITGFLMEDIDAPTIEHHIRRVLGRQDLQQVAENARKFVEKEYSFEKVVARWKETVSHGKVIRAS